LSANADTLEHNNETNTKPDKTEIKSEKRQNYGPFGPYFAQNNETNTKPDKTEIKSEKRQKSPAGLNLVRPKVKNSSGAVEIPS